jgi:hypothetical protein
MELVLLRGVARVRVELLRVELVVHLDETLDLLRGQPE